MTIKEAILKSLEDIKGIANYKQVHDHIMKNAYYDFGDAKTPPATISALLGDFIRIGDSRVKRIKGKGGTFSYYLSKIENEIEIQLTGNDESKRRASSKSKTFQERDLHILLSTFLKHQNTYSKTIFHEKSNNSDNHQK